jgi:hypothetical protein
MKTTPSTNFLYTHTPCSVKHFELKMKMTENLLRFAGHTTFQMKRGGP